MAEIKKFLKKNKGVKMNKKGIFFTLIIFLLATAIILAGAGMKSNTAAQEENITQQAAFESVDSRFENIYNQVLAVKTGYPGRMQGRILAPFTYDSGNDACSDISPAACPCTGANPSPNGCGWIKISQNIPLEQDDTFVKDVYDALNLYAIFISDRQINSDLNVSIIEVPKNSDWGGSGSGLGYLILPQCIDYNPLLSCDGTQCSLPFFTGQSLECTFNVNSIRRIDFDVEIPPPDGQTIVGIKKTEIDRGFNGNSDQPFVSFRSHVPAGQCDPDPQYDPAACDKTIENYVNPNVSNRVCIQIGTGSCSYYYLLDSDQFTPPPPEGNLITIDYNPSLHGKLITETKITFKEPIDEILFNALRYSVEKSPFTNLKRSTG